MITRFVNKRKRNFQSAFIYAVVKNMIFSKRGAKHLNKREKWPKAENKLCFRSKNFGRVRILEFRASLVPNGPMMAISAKNSFFRPFPLGKPRSWHSPVHCFRGAPKRLGGLLCGQQISRRIIYTLHASRYHARGDCFYTVIITLNNSLFKSKFAPQ